jgi:hypothetical protein
MVAPDPESRLVKVRLPLMVVSALMVTSLPDGVDSASTEPFKPDRTSIEAIQKS